VENMSGLACPHCKKDIDLFKSGGGEKIAAEMKVPFLGRIPLDPEMVICSDDGRAFVETYPESIAAKAFAGVAEEWKKRLEKKE
jgi:ATP-binding protein involved in chromosome partitioning